MRQSQKTEQADRRWMDSLEDKEYIGVRSAISGEMTNISGINFQALVLDRNNLNRAYQKVVRNKGAQGIDGMDVDELLPFLKKHRSELITSLVNGTYRPLPVQRIEIPKPDGGTRKLGIPTVLDRLVQQAVSQVMTVQFEKIFSDNSFGFRPKRSAHDAIKRVIFFYNQGYTKVVDIDLKAYFDTVNQDLLMKFIEKQITDKWLLSLIRKFLTSGVMVDGNFITSEAGTPQGGPLSPLLANIYLNELDVLLESRGHKFVRYADDCNIYVKSKRSGERVLENVTKFLEKELKLTVNTTKSKVGSPLRLKFLGFSLWSSRGRAQARPATPSQKRIQQELKQITKRNRGISVEKMLHEIQQKMLGWIQYYSIGSMSSFLKRIDSWLRTRIRQYIWKNWKKTKTKIKNLERLGLSKRDAYIDGRTRKGYWRTAHSKTLKYTLTNEKLEELGLINLTKIHQSIQNA